MPATVPSNLAPTPFVGPLAALWRDAGPTAALLVAPQRCLPVPSAQDRRVWSNLDAASLEDLRARALSDLTTPWPLPLPHEYARYFRDGHRDTYEQTVFARQERVSRAAVLAAVSLDPQWMDEVVDGVVLLCEQTSWCWPAHDDTHRLHGAVVPTVAADRCPACGAPHVPCLDLGAGEVAGQLAWIDHLLGEALDGHAPGLRARVRHEVDRRVLIPFMAHRDWHWLGLDGDVHNWNPWIHGNVLVAALRLVDDPDRRAALVDLVIEGLDRYVASLPDDGAIDEGYSYWWNGACRALEALDLLAHATAGALDATGVPALRATVAFPHRMHLGHDWYLNLADAQARATRMVRQGPESARATRMVRQGPESARGGFGMHEPWHVVHRAALRVGDDPARAHAAAHRQPGTPVAHERQGLGRLLQALVDPAWGAAVTASPPLIRDVWLASTQVLLARRATGSVAGLTLAVKGGHNGEHHNHNDVGAVVVALGGVPVLVDAGRPTYTARTFGPDRYGIWSMQSSWHNVPEIRGTAQREGARHAAREVSATVDDAGASLSLDLALAYPREDIRAWRRTARLDRVSGRVTVTDTWELEPAGEVPPAPTTVRWLAAGEVSVGLGRAEITALDGAGAVVLTWHPADAPCGVTARKLDDPMLSDVWGDQLTRLDIDVTASGPSGTLVVNVEEQQ